MRMYVRCMPCGDDRCSCFRLTLTAGMLSLSWPPLRSPGSGRRWSSGSVVPRGCGRAWPLTLPGDPKSCDGGGEVGLLVLTYAPSDTTINPGAGRLTAIQCEEYTHAVPPGCNVFHFLCEVKIQKRADGSRLTKSPALSATTTYWTNVTQIPATLARAHVSRGSSSSAADGALDCSAKGNSHLSTCCCVGRIVHTCITTGGRRGRACVYEKHRSKKPTRLYVEDNQTTAAITNTCMRASTYMHTCKKKTQLDRHLHGSGGRVPRWGPRLSEVHQHLAISERRHHVESLVGYAQTLRVSQGNLLSGCASQPTLEERIKQREVDMHSTIKCPRRLHLSRSMCPNFQADTISYKKHVSRYTHTWLRASTSVGVSVRCFMCRHIGRGTDGQTEI